MEDRILNEIRYKYSEELEKVKNYQILAKRVSELLKNETVKEYIELIELVKEYDSEKINNFSEDECINSVSHSMMHKIKETNDIFVYIGTYMSSHECDIVHGPSNIRLNRDDPKAEYRIYKNIETSDSEMVGVNQWDEFEKTHKIIYPKTTLTDSFFYAMQGEFFTTAVKESQKAACDKILSEECQKDILYAIHSY